MAQLTRSVKLKYLSFGNYLYIDHGFHVYSELPKSNAGFTAQNFVEVREKQGIYSIQQAMEIEPAHLFNYLAYVKGFVDGDTLWVNINLGLGLFTCQKVRLRGINAAEIKSEKGVKAADFPYNNV